jgi:hypothetical protein
MKKPTCRWTPLFAILLASSVSNAISAKPDCYFGDNMVLQSGMPVPVWGMAMPRENVTVEFAGQTKSAEAVADGACRVVLNSLEVSTEPLENCEAQERRHALGTLPQISSRRWNLTVKC